MNIIIIANAISFLGCIVMILIGLIKDNKKILKAMCLQCGLLGIAMLLLGAFTGAVSNAVTILRNIYSLKREMTSKAKLFFIVIQIALSVFAGIHGAIDVLPIIAATVFTIFMDTDNEKIMKVVVISTLAMWLVYDFIYANYSGVIFDLFSITTNSFTLAKLHFNKTELA